MALGLGGECGSSSRLLRFRGRDRVPDPAPFPHRLARSPCGWGMGRALPARCARGPPGFLERTRKCSGGWICGSSPSVRDSLDLLTSGEEVWRSVAFGFLSVCGKKPISPAWIAGARSSRRAPRGWSLEEREWALHPDGGPS